MDLTPYFATFVAFVGTISIVSEALEHLFHVDGLAAQIRSWVVSVGLAFLASVLEIGMFADAVNTFTIVLYGVGGGLVANGIFAVDQVKLIIQVLLATREKSRN